MIDIVLVQNLLVPFCFVIGKDILRHFFWPRSVVFNLGVATPKWVVLLFSGGHNKFFINQGCPTRGTRKVLMRLCDNFQFSGYNKGYEKEFHES